MSRNSNPLLRIGLAFVFIYPAIAAFSDPLSWIGFFPPFLRSLIGDSILLTLYGISQIGLGLWLLSGKWTREAAGVASLLLAFIVALNFSQLDLLFRDVGLLFAALALVFDKQPEKDEPDPL